MIGQLAKKQGINQWAITRALKTDERFCALVEELWRDEGTTAAVGKRLGVSPGYVQGILEARGIEVHLAAKHEEWLDLLAQFIAEHDRQPRQAEEYQGRKLGRWLANRKHERAGGNGNPESLAMIDERFPGWDLPILERQWEEMFALLVRFYEREGHSRPKQIHIEDGKQLGAWTNRHREAQVALRDGRTPRGARKTTPEQHARFAATFHDWTTDPDRDDWMLRFEMAKAYYAEHGRSPRQRVVVERVLLGTWWTQQLAEARAGSIKPWKLTELETLPFWDLKLRMERTREAWMIAFEQCCEYFEQHGKIPAKGGARLTPDGIDLGAWRTNQTQRPLEDWQRELLEGTEWWRLDGRAKGDACGKGHPRDKYGLLNKKTGQYSCRECGRRRALERRREKGIGPRSRKLNEEQEREVVRRYEAKESALALGREFGVSDATITNTVKRYGLPIRGR